MRPQEIGRLARARRWVVRHQPDAGRAPREFAEEGLEELFAPVEAN